MRHRLKASYCVNQLFMKRRSSQNPLKPYTKLIRQDRIFHTLFQRGYSDFRFINFDTQLPKFSKDPTNSTEVSIPSDMQPVSQDPVIERLFHKEAEHYIQSNDIKSLSILFHRADLQLGEHQLLHILNLLEHNHHEDFIISVYRKNPGVILRDKRIMETLLRCCFLRKEFDLFEEIFAHYLQYSSSPGPRYLILALRVAFSTMSLEYAKQFLYQILSSYTHSSGFLETYLRNMSIFGTFQSVKFAFNIIQREKNAQVSIESYRLLLEIYIKYGDHKDMLLLNQYLEQNNLSKEPEIWITRFCSNLKKDSFDGATIWGILLNSRNPILLDKVRLSNYYNVILAKVCDLELSEQVFQVRQHIYHDDLRLSNNSRRIILNYYKNCGDFEGCFTFLKELYNEGYHIESKFIKYFWLTSLKKYPDLAKKVTHEYKTLLAKHFHKESWVKTLSEELEIGKSETQHSKFLSKLPKASNIYNVRAKLYFETHKYELIIEMVHEMLREGIQPRASFVKYLLRHLVKNRSSQSLNLYKLSKYWIRGSDTIEMDLLWLENQLSEMRFITPTSKDLKKSLIQEFESRYNSNLSYLHTFRLGQLCFRNELYFEAMEFFFRSRSLSLEDNKSSTALIYIWCLKTTTRMLDMEATLGIMNLLATESDLQISLYILDTMKNSLKYFRKKLKSKVETFGELEKRFQQHYQSIVSRNNSQKAESSQKIQQSIDFLNRWLEVGSSDNTKQ